MKFSLLLFQVSWFVYTDPFFFVDEQVDEREAIQTPKTTVVAVA